MADITITYPNFGLLRGQLTCVLSDEFVGRSHAITCWHLKRSWWTPAGLDPRAASVACGC